MVGGSVAPLVDGKAESWVDQTVAWKVVQWVAAKVGCLVEHSAASRAVPMAVWRVAWTADQLAA